MRIRVRDVCPDSRMFRQDGEKLRHEIVARWSAEDPVDVDFENETIASVSFLDEAIAVLFLEHASDYIRARLTTSNLVEGDRRVLNDQVRQRIGEARERARVAG
jgi:hypothetical protein